MGFISCLCRVFLVTVNVLFLLTGLAFFALGMLLRFGSSLINKYIDEVKKSLQTAASATGSNLDLSGFDLKNLLFGVALGFIFFGLFLCILTILGCCGACCKIKNVLLVYLVLCVLLLLGQIAAIVIVYGYPNLVHKAARKRLKDSLNKDYFGLTGSDATSISWNIVMQEAGCCGVDNYGDFFSATKWKTSDEYINKGAIKTPIACCRDLPSDVPSISVCAGLTANENNNFYNTGCYMKVWGLTLGNGKIIAPILGCVGVFQLLIILFGAIIVCSLNDNKVWPS